MERYASARVESGPKELYLKRIAERIAHFAVCRQTPPSRLRVGGIESPKGMSGKCFVRPHRLTRDR